MGDGETAEGSVWEAANVAAFDKLDTLCGITDVNGLGQSGPTQWQHDLEALAARWRAFGWNALIVDGHDLADILGALDKARQTRGRPTMILAKTLKGKGVSLMEGQSGWHGKALKKGAELDAALAELESQRVPEDGPRRPLRRPERPPVLPGARRPLGGPSDPRRTNLATAWRPARPMVPRSPDSPPPTTASSRSTRT